MISREYQGMARTARTVFPGIPHHVTQRGNRRQNVFFSDADRLTYLALFKEKSERFGLACLAYCLMPNHVHHVVVPLHADSLSLVFGTAHSKYSRIINERYEWRGHLWQFRFFSSPLDERYLQEAVRYVELNPVRANISRLPEEYSWSSASARILGTKDPYLNSGNTWNEKLFTGDRWKRFLSLSKPAEEDQLRSCAKKNFPCGSEQFVRGLEKSSGQKFAVRNVGRPAGRREDFRPKKWGLSPF